MKNKATRFVLNNLLILMLILPVLFVLVSAGPVKAATINVPADQSTIQAAINIASPGDTINVAAGTYNENLTVNKSLTLQGANKLTVIVTAADPAVSVFTVTASNVNISGFTATGTTITGNQGYAGIKFGAGVTNCNIHDNILSSNQYGILMLGTLGDTTQGNNIFTNNTASGCGVSGIEMQNTNGNTFTNNTANTNGAQGFRLANSKNNTFTGNTASLNLGPTAAGFFLVVAGGTGSNNNTFINNTANSNVSHGLRIDGSTGNMLTGNTFTSNTFDGIKLKAGSNNTTMNNNLCSLNDIGIDIAEAGIDATSETLSNNNITGNHTYGVRNLGTGNLNAKFNYWNNLSGPSHDGLSYGDSVSANVNFQPWLIALASTAPTLAITTAALPNGTLNVAYSQALAASGGTPPYQWAQYANFPAWLSISTGGLLTGTPPTTGPFDFQVQVRDAHQGIWKAFHLGISTTTLTITTTSLPNGDVGFSYSQTLHASGGSGSYTWSLFSGSPPLPPGLGPITSGGLISGIPTTGGTYPFTVQVDDGSTQVTLPLSITISAVPLNITTLSLPAGNVGTAYTQPVAAAGGSGSYTFSIFSGSLPAVLTLDPGTGVISGTPTTVGTYNFTVRVNDGYTTHDQGLSITINVALVKVTTTTLADGYTGIAYSQTLQASGGSGSYTWTVTSGSLPTGLNPLHSNGVIDGTPTTAGTYPFTVRVNDGSTHDDRALSIAVLGKLLGTDQDPVAPGSTLANYLIMGRFTPVANGSVTYVRVKCTAAGNVKVALYTDVTGYPGTLINANNAGAPVTTGWNNITIPSTPVTFGTYYWIVCNSTATCVGNADVPGASVLYLGYSYSLDFPSSIPVGATTLPNKQSLVAAWGIAGFTPLTITTTSLSDGAVGVAYSQTLQAGGGSGSYTWSITSGSLPPVLSLDPATGIISGTPITAAAYPFTARVFDGSTTVDKALSITINASAVKLVGADDAAATAAAGANYLLMDGFAAVASGTVSQIRVKCTTAGSVKVALYTDSGGSPGTLINANNTGAIVSAGWNNITIPSTAVIMGTNYWIAYNSSSACVGYTPFPGGAILYRSFTYSTAFPASAGTGFTNAPNYHSLIAGWGIAGPSPLAITTTSLPDGTVGVPYSQALQASGGSGSYSWTLFSGSLPPGLGPLITGGLISGTPTTAATYPFTVQVNDGSTTASQPLSITVSPQKMLGADDAVSTGAAGANYLLMDSFAAVASGNVIQIRVKCTTAGSVKVALYTDISGSPGTLINANNTGTVVSPGWNNITIPSTAVIMGTNYWIAYNSSSTCVGYTPFPGGAILYRSFAYSTDFPASAGTGFTNAANYHSLIAGWGF
jgi:parallel beta-helix repeat protein